MKRLLTKGCAVTYMIIAISCAKEDNAIRWSAAVQAREKSGAFTIGQQYGGGIIFYVDSTGQHGLIADTSDLPMTTWWNGTYLVTGTTATGIGAGKSNTKKIVLSQGDSGIYAARECWHCKRSGYGDWFLPSRDELVELFRQKKVVGGFAHAAYWSSSEFFVGSAWVQYFTKDGGYTKFAKDGVLYVRAVRAF